MPQFWGMQKERDFVGKQTTLEKKRGSFSFPLVIEPWMKKRKSGHASRKKRDAFERGKKKNLFQKNRFPSVFFRIFSLLVLQNAEFFWCVLFRKKEKTMCRVTLNRTFSVVRFRFQLHRSYSKTQNFFLLLLFFLTVRQPKWGASIWRQTPFSGCFHMEASSPFSWYHPNPRLRLG